MEETLCSKTHSASSRCRCPPFPKPSDLSNKRKGSFPISSTRRTIKTTWVPYPTKSTTTRNACQWNEPRNSNGGTLSKIQTSISKLNFWPTANPMCSSSKAPAKSFVRNSKRLAPSIHHHHRLGLQPLLSPATHARMDSGL